MRRDYRSIDIVLFENQRNKDAKDNRSFLLSSFLQIIQKYNIVVASRNEKLWKTWNNVYRVDGDIYYIGSCGLILFLSFFPVTTDCGLARLVLATDGSTQTQTQTFNWI